jgi:hypothetical protein
MSKREREAEGRVALPKLGGGKRGKQSRAEYWTLHEKPMRKKQRGTGLEHRLRRDDGSLLQRIHTLGEKSDSVVLREKPQDLVRNLAFVQHQQKLYGLIRRFAKQGQKALPKRVEAIVHKTAYSTLERR